MDCYRTNLVFSPCRRYRWWLKRRINNNVKRTLVFIGLNPSVATAKKDDHTMRRLTRFASDWGYGSLIVINLFAWITKYPKELQDCSFPIGYENDEVLALFGSRWSKNSSWDLWLGWGVGGKYKGRNIEVMISLEKLRIRREKVFPKASGLMVIGWTANGYPLHPLYAPKDLSLVSIS